MVIVNIYYSFDSESPALIFNTEEEAREYIKSDFENEVRISAEEGHTPCMNKDNSGDWARITFLDGEFMEWSIASITDKRGESEPNMKNEIPLMRETYDACMRFLYNAPRIEDDDEYEEVYAEAANFVNAVQNMGFDF